METKACWCRLSRLDAGIFLLCCATTFAVSYFTERGLDFRPWRHYMYSITTPKEEIEKMFRRPAEDRVFNALVGIVVAGPFVLLAQCRLRDRRELLTGGEWIWFIQGVVAIVTVSIGTHDVGCWPIVLEVVLVPFSLAYLLRTLYGQIVGHRLPCLWTDLAGPVSTLVFVLLLAASISRVTAPL